MIDDDVRNGIIAGKTTKEIADELGKSDRWIREVISKNGLGDLAKGRTAEVIQLLEKGYSVNEVIEATDLKKTAIYDIKKKYGINPKKKKRKNARKISKNIFMKKWTSNIFEYIQIKCKDYCNKEDLSDSIRFEIEGDLIDLVMEIDSSAGIDNKEAYFKRSAINRIKKFLEAKTKEMLRSEVLFHDSEDSDGYYDDGEEKYGHNINPENMLLWGEKLASL